MSYDWFGGFKARHPEIALKRPQALSTARAICTTRPVMDKFMSVYTGVLEMANAVDKPHLIYNADESGLSLVPGTVTIVGSRGMNSSQVTNSERGELVTVLACANAVGSFIPPMLIYKGVRKNPALCHPLPPGTLVCMSDSGYIKTPLFLQWLEHFSKYMIKEPDCRNVLVVDGHDSHTKSILVLQTARDLGIELIALPSHTTHIAQPMDKTFFGPLKLRFKEAVRREIRASAGVAIPKIRFPYLFKEAWENAATLKNAISGFEATGLYPVNPSRIDEKHFKPSDCNHQTPLAVLDPPQIRLESPLEVVLATYTPTPGTCTVVSETPESDLVMLADVASVLAASPNPQEHSLPEITLQPSPVNVPFITVTDSPASPQPPPPQWPNAASIILNETPTSSHAAPLSPAPITSLQDFKQFPLRKAPKSLRNTFKAGGKHLTTPEYEADLTQHKASMEQKYGRKTNGKKSKSGDGDKKGQTGKQSQTGESGKIKINKSGKGNIVGKGKGKRGATSTASGKEVTKKCKLDRGDPLILRDLPENFCAKCQANYFDLPESKREQWWECMLCGSWFHESCTDYETRNIDLETFSCVACNIEMIEMSESNSDDSD